MPAAQRPPPPPPLLLLLPTLLLICCLDEAVRAGHVGQAGGLLPSAPGDNGFSTTPRDASSAGPTSPAGRPPSSAAATAESGFSLKVLVRDRVTRQLLPGATVGLCVNHTVMTTAQTGAGGEVLLWVLYSPGLSLTLVGQMEGYVPSPLPWSTTKRPIFSSVTILLLPQSQGNIWLFEDSVLITAKLPDSSSQPMVKFPKNLLTNSDNSNISSVTAYLTVPQYQVARDCVNCTPGVILNKSVLASVELKPVVAISVLLYSGGEELEVRGPIQVSIPLGHNSHLQASDTIPAWAFNLKTGAWENQGLGIVTRVREELVWTYTASHLGNWIAAPLPSSNDQGYRDFFHFMSYQTYLLVGLLGATLVVVIGFFCLMLCHCRRSHREPRRRKARFSKLTVLKKDQTTSTHMEEVLLFHHGENSLASCSIQCETLSTPRHKANFNIYVEDPSGRPSAPLYENLSSERMKGPQSHYINSEEVARIREKSEQNSVNLNSETNFFQDKLVHICNQPMAIIQASDLFASQEQQMSGCKSNTFPRNGGEYDSEPGSKDTYTQTLPKHHHSQDGNSPQTNSQDDPQPLETPPQGPGPNLWGRYNNLLESSVSVPGTLNEAAGMERFSGGHGGPSELQGISERTLLELTRGKSHARAWFVSLDGKPAAQVRHSIIELQGRHRPHSSNDTSLDSGVDMNEPLHSIREQERDRPSIRASSLPFHGRGGRYNEDPDLSSSESGNTATCTPEDFSLRNILDGSSGAIPNIPEERDGMDTSSAQEDSESRGTPPPRRLRKVREKGKSEKRSAKHVRDGRHLSKRS